MRCQVITLTCDKDGCRSRYTPDPADPDPEDSAQKRGWKCTDGRHLCPAHAVATPPKESKAPTEYMAG